MAALADYSAVQWCFNAYMPTDKLRLHHPIRQQEFRHETNVSIDIPNHRLGDFNCDVGTELLPASGRHDHDA